MIAFLTIAVFFLSLSLRFKTILVNSVCEIFLFFPNLLFSHDSDFFFFCVNSLSLDENKLFQTFFAPNAKNQNSFTISRISKIHLLHRFQNKTAANKRTKNANRLNGTRADAGDFRFLDED